MRHVVELDVDPYWGQRRSKKPPQFAFSRYRLVAEKRMEVCCGCSWGLGNTYAFVCQACGGRAHYRCGAYTYFSWQPKERAHVCHECLPSGEL